MATYIALSSGKMKKKRKRTVISKKDLEKLEALFQQDKWPDRSKKMHLAMVISKSENFISTWFQNRRAKFRRLQHDTETLVKNDDTVKLTFHDVRFSGNDISKSNSVMCDKNKESHVRSNQTPIGLEEIKMELNVLNKNQKNAFKRARKVNGNCERDERNGEVVLQDVTKSGITLSWEFVFRQIVEMAAASEGAMADGHPSITQAVRHAALGVPLRDAKLVYSREYGLDCEAA
ncbi:diencephalon/mesencephalon homeobox protein 1-A-like [Mizuhopecten yessoensis]|uniref:Ankyrin repeat domain-containing protein 63 n=1 Tax=Mizuhopecten yessoensis TaxID=6573 RepID=A0A210QXH5_MIZYE|nr:diencephalon/mesencephalon homeobox protein 1-A-like [Mizuhopecten yessoensis]OWF53392.1 Ankyrin repeat domain-containing protein 63 [Mizuhopecten yessoensis]